MASSSEHGSAHEHAVHTNIQVEMGCPVCLNETVEALEADPDVESVVLHSAKGCFEVTHRGSVDDVVSTIGRVGHEIVIASNGEAVMAPVHGISVGTCDHVTDHTAQG